MMVAGWVLLTVTAASSAPVDRTHEAVCELMGLFTAERSFFYEKDRYALPAQVGFLPLPCHDGTRPPVAGPASVGGCGFVFTVTQPGPTLEDLKAEARGVGPGVEGLHFLLDANGVITRAGTTAPVRAPDCDAWRKQADPLWRYHDVVAEKDCIGGPYAADHPCMTALQELAALARAGVGVAQKEYAVHPTAHELVPLAPIPLTTSLCGLLATPEQRSDAAHVLARKGELLDAVLAPRCHAEGLRAALPRLFSRFDAVCPGPHCLTLLALAKSAQMPGYDALVATHASAVVRLLQTQLPDERRRLLTDAVGLSPPLGAALAQTLEGTWPGLPALGKLPRTPLVFAVLALARTEHPSLAAAIALVEELLGRAPASTQTFSAWAQTVPCEQLTDADEVYLSSARLLEIARTHERCQGSTVQFLQQYTAGLPPPRELMEVLEPLPAEKLRWMANELGLDVPERAAALVDWVVDREPKLLDGIHANADVVERLLDPRNVNRLGGRDAVLDYLFKRKGTWHGTLGEDAVPRLVEEALKGQPSPERVRHVASLFMPQEDMLQMLEGVFQAPDPRRHAAAAAGLADWEENSIPPAAARACLAEVRRQHRCLGAAVERLGPPPPGARTFSYGGREQVVRPSSAQALEDYCKRLETAERECGAVCGGAPPMDETLARLEAAAGESATPPDALRACEYSRP